MSGIGGIFEPFYNYVVKQLQRRKEALGAVGAKGYRHPNFHALTTKTCTIRMSSGVDIINSVDNQGNFKYDGLDGISLARRFVLEGTPTAVRAKRGEDGSIAGVKTGTGVLSNEEKVKTHLGNRIYTEEGTGKLIMELVEVIKDGEKGWEVKEIFDSKLFKGYVEGTIDYEFSSTLGNVQVGFKVDKEEAPLQGIGEDGVYGNKAFYGDAADGYGIVPVPGIINAEIRTKSDDGSLREAKVNFVCHNKRQLDILDALYMRPGYPVLLEWGWSPYITNDGDLENDFEDYLDEWWEPENSFEKINGAIRKRKSSAGGNYDGFVGYVKNYQFKVRDDGGYDCTTELIAQGEMLESLTTPTVAVPKLVDKSDSFSYNDNMPDWYGDKTEYDIVDRWVWVLRSIDQFLRKRGDAEVIRLSGTGGETTENKWFWGTVHAPDWAGGDVNNLEADKIKEMNYIHPSYQGGWNSLINMIAEVIKVDRKTLTEELSDALENYSGDITMMYQGQIQKLFKGMALLKTINQNATYDEDDTEESTRKADSGQRTRIYLRWDLICQILNRICWPRYKSDEPMTELTFLNPNERTYIKGTKRYKKSNEAKESFDEELHEDGEDKYYGHKEYIKYRPPINDITYVNMNDGLPGGIDGDTTIEQLLEGVTASFISPAYPGSAYLLEDGSYDAANFPDGIVVRGFHNPGDAYMGVIPGGWTADTYVFPENPDPDGTKYPDITFTETEGGWVYMKERYVPASNMQIQNLTNEQGGDIVEEEWEYDNNPATSYNNAPDIPLPNTVSNPGLIGQSFNDKVCMMPHSPQLYELMYEDIVTNYDENTGATETKQKEVGDAAFTTCTSFEDIAIENISIGLVYFDLDHLLSVYMDMRFERQGEFSTKFSWHKYITRIWDDVNKACGDVYDFGIHLEHERPHVGRIIDYNFAGITKKNIYEFSPQGLNSITREFNYTSKISNDFASVISIAAQAPNQIHSLEALSFKAFHKGIKSRFTTGDAMEQFEKDKNIARDQLQKDINVYNIKQKDLRIWLQRIIDGDFRTRTVGISANFQILGLSYDTDGIGPDTAADYVQSLLEDNIKIKKRYPLKCNEKSTYEGCVKGEPHPRAGQWKDTTVERSAVIPLEFNIQMDGIGGIVPLQLFKIAKEKLPLGYQEDEIAFIIKSETQKITAGQDWITEISGQLTLLNTKYNVEGDNSVDSDSLKDDKKDKADKIDNENCKTKYTFGFSAKPSADSVPSAEIIDILIEDIGATKQTAKAIYALLYAEASKYKRQIHGGKRVTGFKSPGGHNYGGVQTDNAVWSGTSKDGSTGPIIGQWCQKDSGNVYRAFAMFEDDEGFIDHLYNIVVGQTWRGLNTDDADQWTRAYIDNWWSPAAKGEATHLKGGTVYNQKKAIFTSAMNSYSNWERNLDCDLDVKWSYRACHTDEGPRGSYSNYDNWGMF